MDNIKVRNPVTGQIAGSVHPASISDLTLAVSNARRAQQKWSRQSFRERAAIIAAFHDRVIDQAPLILDTIQMETGKTRRDSLAEVVSVAGTARYYLAHGEAILTSRHKHG